MAKHGILKTFIEKTEHIILNNIVILKDDEKIAEYHWEPEIRHNQYSISKSFTSLAIGLAIEEGLLALDDRVIDFFPEETPGAPGCMLKDLRVRHLLTMTIGHKASHLMGNKRYMQKELDWVKHSLSLSIEHKPGTKFVYSNVGPYLAGIIIKKLTGTNLLEYLMPRLFEPLNIWLPTWETDPFGNSFGSSGLMLSTSEIAKFGQLCLQEGRWNGKQLIPKDWVHEASKCQIKTQEDSPHYREYGYLFWRGLNNSYRADGKYGQYSIIMPEKNAVVAINAYNRGKEDILDYVWKWLYPRI